MSDRFYHNIIRTLKIITFPLVKMKITGLENIPKTGGAVIAPNHISNLDPVLAGIKISTRRPVRALAKHSLFSVPVVGAVLKKMGHVPVIRNSHNAAEAYNVAVSRVQNGEAIALFPEGTIPQDITSIGKLKTGAARLALATGAPLIPVAQWGAHNVLPTHRNPAISLVKAIFTRPQHVIIVGTPIQFTPKEGIPVTHHENVKALNKLLAEELEKLIAPLRQANP